MDSSSSGATSLVRIEQEVELVCNLPNQLIVKIKATIEASGCLATTYETFNTKCGAKASASSGKLLYSIVDLHVHDAETTIQAPN